MDKEEVLSIITEAYEIVAYIADDAEFRELFIQFGKDYAGAQSSIEWAEFAGGGLFEIVLTALLLAFTGGLGNAAQIASKIRHAARLRTLGGMLRKLGKLLKRKKLSQKTRGGVDAKHKVTVEKPEGQRLSSDSKSGQTKEAPGTAAQASEAPSVTLLKPKQGVLRGDPEQPHANANADMVRSLKRQNESAELLANRGLEVTHLPNTGKKGGNPDLDIGGRPADVYSPKSKNPNTIRDNMIHKVEHQAPDIVLNLTDSPLTSADMLKFLEEKPVHGLENLYLIKGDEVLLKRY